MLTYVQADRLVPSPIAGASDEYDGVGLSMPNHPDQLRAPLPEDDAITRQLPLDELETFSGPIVPRLMHVDQETLVSGGPGVAAYLAFARVETAQALAALHAARQGLGRVVLNRIRRNASLEPPFDQYAAILELCAPDEACLAARFAADVREVWREAALVVVARENLLWDMRARQSGSRRSEADPEGRIASAQLVGPATGA